MRRVEETGLAEAHVGIRAEYRRAIRGERIADDPAVARRRTGSCHAATQRAVPRDHVRAGLQETSPCRRRGRWNPRSCTMQLQRLAPGPTTLEASDRVGPDRVANNRGAPVALQRKELIGGLPSQHLRGGLQHEVVQ